MIATTSAPGPSIPLPALQSAALTTQAQPGAGLAVGGAGTGASNPASQAVVGEASTVSATGMITTVITYANGATATMTSSGPMPASTQSIVV